MHRSALRQVEVSAPSRLHFGLLSIGDHSVRQYGGAGVMVQSPRTTVRVAHDVDLVVRYGPWARRVAEIAQTWSRRRLQRRRPPVFIDVRSEVLPHRGLGSGTQLALAVARALNRYFELEDGEPSNLAATVDRGQRSAVGTYGFFHGGLIVEAGRSAAEPLAELTDRTPLPSHWRFLLIQVGDGEGKSGTAEQQAFTRLPAVTPETRQQLWEELVEGVLPAARQGDLARFGEHVYRYGVLSGQCFANEQGGPYASQAIAAVVAELRSWGLAGVGQSSWGPTVFAVADGETSCRCAWEHLRQIDFGEPLSHRISAPDNQGAAVRDEF